MMIGCIILLFHFLLYVPNNFSYSNNLTREECKCKTQVKRNEAICCLIGFGIGIGCCLMFRWLKNTFFKMNLITTSPSIQHRHLIDECCLLSEANKSRVCHRRHHLYPEDSFESNNDNSIFTNTINNFNTFNNTNMSSSEKKRGRIRKGDRLSRSSSQLKDMAKNNDSKQRYKSFDNFLQLKYMDQPINDIYQNLAKFLTRNFCKSFKLRRSMSGKRVVDGSRETKNRLNLLFKNMRTESSQAPILPAQSSFSSTTFADSVSSPSTRHQTRSPPNLESFNQLYFSQRPQSPVAQPAPPPRSRTVSNSAIGAPPVEVCERMSRSNTALNDLAGGACGGGGYFDERSSASIDQLFPGGSSSCRSSTFDIDFSIDSRAIDAHSIRSATSTTTIPKTGANHVEKSLDEALHHIDKLKEDMSHLCKDLDTLYSRRIIYDPSFVGAGEHFKSSNQSINTSLPSPSWEPAIRRISNFEDGFFHYRSNASLSSTGATRFKLTANKCAETQTEVVSKRPKGGEKPRSRIVKISRRRCLCAHRNRFMRDRAKKTSSRRRTVSSNQENKYE